MKKVKYGHRDYAPKDGSAPPHGYKTSRREFLLGAAALPVAHPIFPLLQEGKANRGGRPVLAYVGTYSSPPGPEGAVGHGQGIHLLLRDPPTRPLRQRDAFPSDANPSWRALDPSRTPL